MALTAGTRFGTYQIVAPLGSGGMGEVYRARDAKLDRDVAIKVLPQHLTADADALARFEREAKAVAALSHPNILAIFDFGTHEGQTYAVTELLEGETLRGRLDAGAIPQHQAVNWAQQIARGLAAAHSKGVIHRDLKPENVFVTRDGHVKILDFGLAKRAEQVTEQTNAPTGSGHTAPGTVMGTVGYMSPEQVRGLPVDHRSDIFSFGAVLYELLSGRKAFKKDTASDTIASIMRDEPPELSGSGRPIPVALDHIVRHCLEKDRENRFGTASDVAFALSEASGATSAVTSGSQVVAAAPPPRRKSGVWIAAAVVAIAALAVLLLLRRPHAGGAAAGGAKRVAVLPFENLGASEDDYFADGIADQVRGKLTSVPGIVVIARGSSTPYKKTTKTSQEIAKELSASYLLTATVRWEKGGGKNRVQVNPELVEILSEGPPASKWQQSFDASLTDVFQVQSDIATKVAQALGTTLGAGEQRQLAEKPTQNLAAYDAYLKGEQVSGAMTNTDPPTLRKSLGLYEQAVALDPGFAEGWARVSVASSLLYRNGVPTPELADRSLKAAEKSLSLAPNRPEPYHALGNYQRLVKQDYAAAREQYAKGLRLAPNDINNLGSAVGAEQSSGMWDAALEHARAAERLDPRSLGAARRVGLALIRLRRYAEARQALDRALTISPSNLLAILSKTMAFLGEGNLAGARAFLETSTRSVEPTALVAFVANYQDLGWVLTEEQQQLLLRLTPDAFDGDRTAWAICLTQGYALKGDAANVRVHAEEARKANEEQLRDAPNDAQRRAFLGLSLAYLGRKDEAIREGLRAVEMQPISSDAVNGPYLQHQLARIYMLTGEPEKAIDRIEGFLKVPYYVSPGWLKIDPNFDPLRNNPRFQKLVAGAK
ncbi:MAG TPA: protein kinase [Thermoanaerobaculia bacterium]